MGAAFAAAFQLESFSGRLFGTLKSNLPQSLKNAMLLSRSRNSYHCHAHQLVAQSMMPQARPAQKLFLIPDMFESPEKLLKTDLYVYYYE